MAIFRNKKMFSEIFSLNEKITLTNEDKEYLNDLYPELEDEILANGTENETQIKEIITDILIKDEQENILDYLSLNFKASTKERAKLMIDKFKTKIEINPGEKDFFKSYLIDDTLDDINMVLKGYIKSVDGTKDIYIKNREAISTSDVIDVINIELISMFNKINFMSEKKDEEVSEMVMFSLGQIVEILEDLPYEVCNTQDTRMILTIVATKLVNILGYLEGNRKTLFESLNESYKSSELTTDNDSVSERD